LASQVTLLAPTSLSSFTIYSLIVNALIIEGHSAVNSALSQL